MFFRHDFLSSCQKSYPTNHVFMSSCQKPVFLSKTSLSVKNQKTKKADVAFFWGTSHPLSCFFFLTSSLKKYVFCN